MSHLEEIKKAIKILTQAGTPKKNITVLHCNTDYPSSLKDINLKAMMTIKKKLGVKVGYSDHSLGDLVAVAATSLGASVIEKHPILSGIVFCMARPFPHRLALRTDWRVFQEQIDTQLKALHTTLQALKPTCCLSLVMRSSWHRGGQDLPCPWPRRSSCHRRGGNQHQTNVTCIVIDRRQSQIRCDLLLIS